MFHTSRPGVEIREARPADYESVSQLMVTALSEAYDGDHRAHADRIFYTHLAGGQDPYGHFSFEQKMFILTVNDVFAGMLHLVGKRQGTFKISPIIVAPEYRRHQGFGELLLGFAERYVDERLGRHLYCTVAEDRSEAYRFFASHGFRRAGISESHFRSGVREHIMYKPLGEPSPSESRTVALFPYSDDYEQDVRELIAASDLNKQFNCIDDGWINQLFEGFRRRHREDVNVKYKLIHLAVDRQDSVVGVCVSTPKKGRPVKLLPIIASSLDAFSLFLDEMPWAMRGHSHKLYTHLDPDVEQTMALQRSGWTLDAVLPAAYAPDRVTQQWGRTLERKEMRTLQVKRRFFNLILAGVKTLEVRVAYDSLKTIKPGDPVCLKSGDVHHEIKVSFVRKYPDFPTMLRNEDPTQIAPNHRGSVLKLLQDIYPPNKERLGVLVLGVEPVDGKQSSLVARALNGGHPAPARASARKRA